jgi:flagellar basal-body rod protein FlgC
MDFSTSLQVAAAGLRAQSGRMRIIAENLANADDQSQFRMQYDPGNPAADAKGYVHLPNVNALVEMMDMRDAQRSYEANLQVMDASRSMLSRTVDLLRR